MAQTTDILIANAAVHYTRADFTALRAYLNRIPVAHIAERYYDEETLAALGCFAPADLQRRLEDMRDTLMGRVMDSNPHAAEGLRTARRLHVWSRAAIDFLVRAADADTTRPKRQDPVSAWFKPRVAVHLKAEGARTLGELVALIQRRGAGWWKPIPRIGAGKAASILRWLEQHESALGPLRMTAPALSPGELVVLAPENRLLLPMERFLLPRELDGSQGLNRNGAFCLISARNDLEAIDAYLYRYRGQEKTERAYRKELERFLLWCIYEGRKPMSSVLLEDCEAYKDFLAGPPAEWIGPRTVRLGPNWKPFAGAPSAKSQRYGVQALRSFFKWLVDVRYLAGNPWITVADPPMAKAILPLQIDRALPADLWRRLVGEGGVLDVLSRLPAAMLQERYRLRGAAAGISMPAQYRLVRAALLLLGDGGLRREEAAYASRDKLRRVPGTADLWELDVLGKRSKWRTVFLPARAVEALQAHWQDRGLDFSFGMAEIPLLSPLVAPPTLDALAKHVGPDGRRKESGFSEDGLYRVIKGALARIAGDTTLELDSGEREMLQQAGPHAFRHTFATQAAAGDVPLDVLQKVLGHASLQTTTIYVQAEKKRSIEELGKFFRKDD